MAIVCPFCLMAVETLEQVLFGCSVSWRSWMDCLQWWEFLWCCPNDPQAFFKVRCGLNLAGQETKMWTTLFYVIIWSIWNLRNRVVLEQYKPDWSFELRQIKVRWGFWLKTWLDGKNVMTEELSSNPSTLRKWRWLIQTG